MPMIREGGALFDHYRHTLEELSMSAYVNGRWRAYDYEELRKRDKASLDIFWLKDESLSDSDNLPAPEVMAAEIVEDLEAALEQSREILADVGPEVAEAER